MISVRNWDRFQDKRLFARERKTPPPWLKLWMLLFDDPSVRALSAAQFRVYVFAWGWAARTRNAIPADDAWWRSEFGRRGPEHRDALVELGFLEVGPTVGQLSANLQPNGRQLAKGFESATDVAPIYSRLEVDEDEEKPLRAKKTRAKERPRDELWDVLVEVFRSTPAAKTSAHGARNRAVQELRAHGATPELVRLVVKKYVERWGRDKLTDVALAKHYPALAGDVAEASRRRAAACPDCGTGGGLHSSECVRYAA